MDKRARMTDQRAECENAALLVSIFISRESRSLGKKNSPPLSRAESVVRRNFLPRLSSNNDKDVLTLLALELGFTGVKKYSLAQLLSNQSARIKCFHIRLFCLSK